MRNSRVEANNFFGNEDDLYPEDDPAKMS